MRRMMIRAAATAALATMAAAPAHRAPVHAASGGGPVTGPIADYWISADTTSGMGAGLMGGGGRPSMGAIMGMASGRGPSSTRTLDLVLGSSRRPSGPPAADHFVPQGLGVGPSLPLVTPQPASAHQAPTEAAPSEPYQRPKGRILIYWGCGEHVGPGQPVVFDFSTIGRGAPMPDLAGSVHVNAERPPSVDRWATLGHWPNERRQVQVPSNGSLVGSHSVRGDYSPDMAFEVGPDVDFLPALGLANSGTTPQGGKRLTWRPPSTATGFHLMLIGAQGEGGDPTAQGATMVFWSSSAVKPGFFGGGLADYLPPAEVARLVAQRAVLPPGTSECVVPSEVAQAAPMGFVNEIAYGPEQSFSDPPRPTSGPWNIAWRAKVRVKATASLLLGLPSMDGSDDGDDNPRARRGGGRGDPRQAPAQPATPADAAKELLRRFRPF